MGCKAPLQALRNGAGAIRLLPRFVQGLDLNGRLAFGESVLELPCGKCAQCRVARAQEWALRCHHEAQFHRHDDGSPNAAFVTLTFENEGLAFRELKYGTHPLSLSVRDWQLFAKRLRQHIARQHRRREKKLGLVPSDPPKFKFFAVGEYGREKLRPHYHVLLFGWDFSEDRVQCTDEGGMSFFLSPTLEKLWGYGRTDIRPMTPETINYVCRYVVKKLTGEDANRFLQRIDPDTGDVITVAPEFAVMSRNPGIGARWFDRFKDDVYPDNFVILKGRPTRVPRYYANRLKQQDPERAEAVADKAKEKAKKFLPEKITNRRKVKVKVTKARIKLAASRKLD